MSTTIYANKDSQGNSAFPSQTYGSTDPIKASWFETYQMNCFFGFDISSISGMTIISATLYLNKISGTSNNTYVERITDNSWSEAGVNWGNQPASTITNRITITPTSGWNSWDITNMFKDETGSNFSVKCIRTSLDNAETEFGAAYTAYLVIDATSPTDVYINSSSGSDSNAGDSCTAGHPVLTLAKALELVASGGEIHVCNNGADFSAENVTINKTIYISSTSGYSFYLGDAI